MGDGVDTDAATLLGELTENAIAAVPLGGRQPSCAGRLEWAVREAWHDLMQPETAA